MSQWSKPAPKFRIFVVAVVGLMASVISGCAPRGETSSVDEILQTARDRYAAINSSITDTQVSPDSRKSVDGVVQAIESLIDAAAPLEKAAKARMIEQNLQTLLPRAGYTTRPAMAELQKQYAQLAEALAASGTLDAGTLKLAASRAYMVLASELETTKFAL